MEKSWRGKKYKHLILWLCGKSLKEPVCKTFTMMVLWHNLFQEV